MSPPKLAEGLPSLDVWMYQPHHMVLPDGVEAGARLTDQKNTDHLMMRPQPQRGAKWTRLDEKLEDFMTTWDTDNGGYEVLKYLSAVSAAI